MKRFVIALALFVASVAPLAAQDMLDLHTVAMPNSPPVADWLRTVAITRVDMDPRGGVALSFDHALPDRWKWFSNPLVPDEHFLFTVWACVQRTYCAGFVQMWAGRSMTDGSLPAILTGYVNWWGDVRHLWDGMSDYRPQPGDEIGFFVTAGNGRLRSDVTSVAERSNVVVVRLPAGDSGHFAFGELPPTPPVIPVTPVIPITPITPVTPLAEGVLLARLDALTALVQELVRADGDAHAAIQQNVTDGRAENRSFFKAVGDHWKSISAIAAPFVTWYVTKRTVEP